MDKHGGDWKSYFDKYGKEPLDFSSSISPLGLPNSAAIAVLQALKHISRYPDPINRELRKRLSEHMGICADWIICGNGASDLIERFFLTLKPKKVLVPVPIFGDYISVLKRNESTIVEYKLSKNNNFQITENFLNAITSDLSLVLLCEPNNPTGIATDFFLLKRIFKKCRENNIKIFIDICFAEFMDDKEFYQNLLSEVYLGDIFLLQAFTKFYGMAGLRLGYGIYSNKDFLEKMRENGQTWSVSTVAEAAGLAVLQDENYADRLRDLIRRERKFLFDSLNSLGCNVIPGKANFLLFESLDSHLDMKLAEKGIMIRSCSNFENLSSNWYRVAIRTHRENVILIETLKKVLNK